MPELPRSTGATWRGRGASAPREPAASRPSGSTTAPRVTIAAAVHSTSSPEERPVIVEVPSASAASSSARCEIDLSPGTATEPTNGAPPRTVSVLPLTQVSRAGWSSARYPRAVTASTSVGAERASTTRTSTPRSPSTEWAISTSSMLTPSSVASVVISASTPSRSGTGMRISACPSVRGARSVRARRCRGRTSEDLEQCGVVALGDPAAHAGERLDELIEGLDDGLGVVIADAGPDRRLPGRDPGHVAEAARGQLEDRRTLVLEIGREGHERGRGQVGHVGDHRDEGVVPVRVERDDVGPEVGEHRAETRVRGRVGRGARGQHPGRAHEEVGCRPFDPHLFGAGHRVAAHEEGVVDRGHEGALHAPDVGHDGRRGEPAGEHLGDDRGRDVHRRRDHDQLCCTVLADLGDRPELDRPLGDAGRRVEPAHVPAATGERHPDRAADEAGAVDHGPPAVPRRAVLSRGGRHGVPGRPRGRRGGSPRGGGQW